MLAAIGESPVTPTTPTISFSIPYAPLMSGGICTIPSAPSAGLMILKSPDGPIVVLLILFLIPGIWESVDRRLNRDQIRERKVEGAALGRMAVLADLIELAGL